MTPPAAAPAFLARCGWEDAEILPLAGDASFRRYFRIVAPGRRAVLMDAPPPHEDPRPFLKVAGHLSGIGLRAPAVLGADPGDGLVLLEDFGDARMREALDAEPARETAIYAETIALLKALHAHPAADLPPYSRAELQREAGLFVEWYCPAAGLSVDVRAYRAAWDAAFDRIAPCAEVTVLRDYHAENIMLLDPGSGAGAGVVALGLLDFQDALVGHPAYDLVSMLQDARRDVSPKVEDAMRDLYGRSDAFDTAYAVLGAQRNAKILGIFTRLWKRDGKPRYLDYLPRVWGYLERDLTHPALIETAAWFAAEVPAAKRGTLA